MRMTVTSPEVFIQAIEETQAELQRQQVFLQRALSDPKLLFVNEGDILNSTRNIIFQVMNHWRREEDHIIVHDFQKFLASIVNDYVQRWAEEQGVPGEIRVQVRQPNTFPSLFAVYCGGTELLQFNILEKFYGIREKAKSESEIRREYSKRDEETTQHIEEINKKISDYCLMRDRLFAYVRAHYRNHKKKGMKMWLLEIGDYWHMLFKQKKVRESLKQRIANLEAEIARQKEFSGRWPILSEAISAAKERTELTERIIPLFELSGYHLETERHRLY